MDKKMSNPMKVKELRDLIEFISSTGLEEVNIETEEFKVRIKRSAEHIGATLTNMVAPAPVYVSPPASSAPVSSTVSSSLGAPAPTPTNATKYIEVKSPMIGTFYKSPNPDSPTFVNIGDKIKPGDTLCIIEAMKLFNEIEAEVSGTIVKILVENATPVEYDQPLFLVDPS